MAIYVFNVMFDYGIQSTRGLNEDARRLISEGNMLHLYCLIA